MSWGGGQRATRERLPHLYILLGKGPCPASFCRDSSLLPTRYRNDVFRKAAAEWSRRDL